MWTHSTALIIDLRLVTQTRAKKTVVRRHTNSVGKTKQKNYTSTMFHCLGEPSYLLYIMPWVIFFTTIVL